MTTLPFYTAVTDDFEAVNQLIMRQLHSRVPLVEKIGSYIISAGGKRLRPLVVLLGARACGLTDARPHTLAAIIEFMHTSTLRERWLVLNKCDQLLEDEQQAILDDVVERLEWEGPVFVISASERQGTDELAKAVMNWLDERELRMQEDEEYAAEVAELDRRIEEEARAHIQELDDRKARRKAGISHDEDDDFDDEDDEDGPEIIYVR